MERIVRRLGVLLWMSLCLFILESKVSLAQNPTPEWKCLNPAPACNSLYSIAFGNNTFVAVGGAAGVSEGVILTSSDGLGWTIADANGWSTFYDVVYAKGRFVAVGVSGAFTSRDGRTWMQTFELTPNIHSMLTRVAYGAGRFVAVGTAGIIVSEDGQAWTKAFDTKDLCCGVAYGNSKFVVGAKGKLLISSDGLTWKQVPSPGTGWISVLGMENQMFVLSIFDLANKKARYFSSNDGETWRECDSCSRIGEVHRGGYSQVTRAYGAGRYVDVSGGYGNVNVIRTSLDGRKWTNVAPIATKAALMALAYGDGTFVAVGSGGEIVASSLGTTWIHRDSGLALTGRDVMYGGGRFVAAFDDWPFCKNLKLLVSSDSGATWVERFATIGCRGAITYGDGKFVMVMGTKAYISPDGVNWSAQESHFETRFSDVNYIDVVDITYADGQFIAVGAISSGGKKFTSSDGKTGFSGGNTEGAIFTSLDGINWVQRSPGVKAYYFNGIASGPEGFVAVADDGIIATSQDGVTWTSRQPVTMQWLRAAAYGSGWYVAVGDNIGFGGAPPQSQESIVISRDGVSWSPLTPKFGKPGGPSGYYNDIVYALGRFVAVGGDGTIIGTNVLEDTTLTLQLGSTKMEVKQDSSSAIIPLDAPPILFETRTFLPIRPLVEALGGQVVWDPSLGAVDIVHEGRAISLRIGRSEAIIDGEAIPIDATNPQVRPFVAPPGRLMLPLRFVAETLGAQVEWDAGTKTIKVVCKAAR